MWYQKKRFRRRNCARYSNICWYKNTTIKSRTSEKSIGKTRIEKIGTLIFTDIHVYDWNGEKVRFEKNQRNPSNYFYMEIDFKSTVCFKYIEFIDLKIPSSNNKKGKVNFLTSDKNIVCTTTVSEKKYKIYNTAFLYTLWYVFYV